MVHGMIVIGIAGLAFGYAVYKHLTVAAVKAELAKIEAEAVADAKLVVARIRAVL